MPFSRSTAEWSLRLASDPSGEIDGRQLVVRSTFGCGEAVVALVADPPTTESVRWLADPYFTWAAAETPRDAAVNTATTWTVYADAGMAPPAASWRTFETPPVSAGEATRVVRVAPDTRSVVLDQPVGPWRALHALRLIRTLLRYELADRGWTFLHGGLVDIGGRGVAMIGGKRAGKTSSVLALLAAGGVAYSANDDLTVRADGSTTVGRGWPRAIAVRPETIDVLASAGAWPFGVQRLGHPANAGLRGDPTADECVCIHSTELVHAFGTTVVPEVPLGAVVFPCFTRDPDGPPRLESISPEQVGALLAEHRESRPDRHEPFLAEFFDRWTLAAGIVTNVATIARSVPAFTLTQGIRRVRHGAHAVLAEVRR